MTVFRWAESYAGIMTAFADKITPQASGAWRTDELYVKIKGSRRWLFAMLDSETRFRIVRMVAEHKGADDVAPMFKEAKKMAGKWAGKLAAPGKRQRPNPPPDHGTWRGFDWIVRSFARFCAILTRGRSSAALLLTGRCQLTSSRRL